MRSRSLRKRTFARFALLFAGVLVGLWLLGAGYGRWEAQRSADKALKQIALKLEHDLSSPNARRSPQAVLSANLPLLRDGNIAVVITDHSDRVLARSQAHAPGSSVRIDSCWRVLKLSNARYNIIVSMPWERIHRQLNAQTLVSAVVSLLGFLILVAGAWRLTGATLAPVRELTQQARGATAEQRRLRLESPSNDREIQELIGSLNGMLARREGAAGIRGRFYSASSHELRTPLQALSGHLELALSRPRSVEEYRTAVEEAYSQTRRLASIMEDLLLLSRLESRAKPPVASVYLAEVCNQTLQEHRGLIEARSLRIRMSVDDSVEVSAPESHAEMVVRNLVANAVKYAVEGSEVNIELERETRLLRLNISNQCDALDANLDEMFEPFFRSQAARQRNEWHRAGADDRACCMRC